jgi:hypothetical protein
MKKQIFLLIGLVASLTVSAQVKDFFQPLGTNLRIDTCTNTATAFVTTREVIDTEAKSTVIQVNVTKISGTVGGTISLLGSLDGVNYKAIVVNESQTALATITATDATTSYHWRLTGSPYRFYRVSWTGTGTMSASFAAMYFRNKE